MFAEEMDINFAYILCKTYDSIKSDTMSVYTTAASTYADFLFGVVLGSWPFFSRRPTLAVPC